MSYDLKSELATIEALFLVLSNHDYVTKLRIMQFVKEKLMAERQAEQAVEFAPSPYVGRLGS